MPVRNSLQTIVSWDKESMRLVSKIIAAIVFVILFGFALENLHEAELHFFFKYDLKLPLALVLFGFFVLGAVGGVLAMMPSFFRQRRDLAMMKKTLADIERERSAQQVARENPPQPDSVVLTP
jgi:uncharacterized integral membrane protein